MNKLLGNEIEVVMKDESIFGLLFDLDEEFVYLQRGSKVYSVPKENIKYYVSETVNAEKEIDVDVKSESPSVLQVFIDGDLVSEIPTQKIDLDVFSNDIMNLVISDADVQEMLIGRVQTKAEYFPGKLYMYTAQDEEFNPNPQPQRNNVSFSMGAGSDPTNSYMSPSEMVSRLNNVAKKGKK